MHDDELTFDQARTASDINLLIAPPLKVSDCSQIHRRRSGGGFVLETFRRKSATARGRATHRLCAHDGLFVVKRRTRPIFRWLGKPPSKPMRWLASARATLMARKCNDCF